MEPELIVRIAKDLGIRQYINETNDAFYFRVLYSAMASWIKASALDRQICNTLTGTVGVSRKYILTKCERILQTFLNMYPELRSRFIVDSDKESSPVSLIRKRLIIHGDLLNAGFDTNLALSKKTIETLTPCLSCVRGEIISAQWTYSGIAMVNYQNIDYQLEQIEDVEMWLNNYLKTAWWQKDLHQDNLIYFNPFAKSLNNSSWQDQKPAAVNDMILAKTNGNKGEWEYFLINTARGLVNHLDPLYTHLRYYRKVIFALRKMANNLPTAILKHYNDHVSLTIRFYFPADEENLLTSYAWPQHRIENRLGWDMSNEVWEYIKPYIIGLGIRVKEELYE